MTKVKGLKEALEKKEKQQEIKTKIEYVKSHNNYNFYIVGYIKHNQFKADKLSVYSGGNFIGNISIHKLMLLIKNKLSYVSIYRTEKVDSEKEKKEE